MLGLLRGGSFGRAAVGRGLPLPELESPRARGGGGGGSARCRSRARDARSRMEASPTRDFLDSCTSYGDLPGEAQMCHVMDALREQRSMLLHIIARLPPIEGVDPRAAAALSAGWLAGHARGKPCPEGLPPSPEDGPLQRRAVRSGSASSGMAPAVQVKQAAQPSSPPTPSPKPPLSARSARRSARRTTRSPTRAAPTISPMSGRTQVPLTEADESSEHVLLQVEGDSAAGPRGRGRAGAPAGEGGARAGGPTLLDASRLHSSSGDHELEKLERGHTDELSLQSSHASDFSPPPQSRATAESPSRSMSSIERQHRKVVFRDRTSTLKSMKSRLGFVKRIDFSDSMVRVATTVRHTSQSVGPGRMQKGLTVMADWLDAMLVEGEPPRTGRLNQIVNESKPFEMLCLSVIVFNGFFVGYTTNREMAYFDAHPTQDWSQVQPPKTPKEWLYIEIALVVWYCIELAMRLSVHKAYYFFNQDAKWNIMDFLLVAFSILDLIGSATQVGFFRMIRVFKVVKVLRTLRAMRFFQELRLMVDCALGSFMQLLWCLVVIAFILYLFSLVFVQGMADYLTDLVADEATLTTVQVERYTGVVDNFGSVPHAMLLLLQSVTGGLDWEESCTTSYCCPAASGPRSTSSTSCSSWWRSGTSCGQRPWSRS
ncbi:unnamed protein product [Prorocentrum cordatum]|uniref:Ion transport domain-containing protein n=1 Tax=Prorocentrum cordatum TaxID=2364126 RepID=A0ABN9S4N0_9DINO|nr:unnamed protein product [Polarella glacialis]